VHVAKEQTTVSDMQGYLSIGPMLLDSISKETNTVGNGKTSGSWGSRLPNSQGRIDPKAVELGLISRRETPIGLQRTADIARNGPG
jgi:hypothetical protein